MCIVIHEQTCKARKRYSDNSEILEINDLPNRCKEFLSTEEQIELEALLSRKTPYIIEIGDLYVRQFNTDGGDVWTFRAHKLFFKICSEMGIFDDY